MVCVVIGVAVCFLKVVYVLHHRTIARSFYDDFTDAIILRIYYPVIQLLAVDE